MPHIVVKLWPGRDEEVKRNLAEKIADMVVAELGSNRSSVSVAIEEVAKEDWGEQVYKKEIKDNPTIYVKPGYEYE